MTNEIAADPRNFSMLGATFRKTGIEFSQRLSLEEWQNMGMFLERADASVQWWIGDWLAYGERRQDWGEMYDRASEIFDRDYQTLANYKYVSANVEPDVRREALTWKHHACVAPLEKRHQRRWLAKAEEEPLSANELRKLIKNWRPAEEGDEDELYFLNIPEPDVNTSGVPADLAEALKRGARLDALVEHGLSRILEDLYSHHDWLYEGERDDRQLPRNSFRIGLFQPMFDKLAEMIDGVTPRAVCPSCDGGGCMVCRGRGWVTGRQ